MRDLRDKKEVFGDLERVQRQKRAYDDRSERMEYIPKHIEMILYEEDESPGPVRQTSDNPRNLVPVIEDVDDSLPSAGALLVEEGI